MDKGDFEVLVDGLGEALDDIKARKGQYVRDVRAKTHLNQSQFAARYHLSVRTLQNWEGGKPIDRLGRVLLRLIERDPVAIDRMLNGDVASDYSSQAWGASAHQGIDSDARFTEHQTAKAGKALETAMSETHVYRLKFAQVDEQPMPEIEFEAYDAVKALELAHDLAREKSAELWQDGRKVCSIRRTTGELWEVSPPN